MNPTSFAELSTRHGIGMIEIPIIQRDFAQGRNSDEVKRIRRDFLTVLHAALTTDKPVNLDFIYGKRQGDTLIPLDGQQRLTTLFLLHFYIATRAGVSKSDFERLPKLSYQTRASARRFCEKLIKQRAGLPRDMFTTQTPSIWLRDQSWFLATWRHDPTIESMLVVLDEIQLRFAATDCVAAWARLTDPDNAAIAFHFLAIKELSLTDDLYIKMNSRGKPLTTFERFKAGIEETIRSASETRYQDFIHKIDTSWSDVFWARRGGKDSIDDEMMRYLRYVAEMLSYWTRGKCPEQETDVERAAALYGVDSPHREANLDFLFAALDCWHGKDVAAWFNEIFVKNGHQPGKVTLFEDVDLLAYCCSAYGRTLARDLMLFGVLLHLRECSPQFPERIRILRNLVRHSSFHSRREKMPELLEDIRKIIIDGNFAGVTAFGQRQLEDERRKAAFIAKNPTLAATLYQLEDHHLLRGRLVVFDLDATSIKRRAAEFAELFASTSCVTSEVSAALLACGDYSLVPRHGRYQFSRPSDVDFWGYLFTTEAANGFSNTKAVLQRLLDQVGADTATPLRERVASVRLAFLDECEKARELDWRYYMVKYSEMREGQSGLFISGTGHMGFNLCMMDKERLSSYYRDPYLYAVARRGNAVYGRDVKDWWFIGYAEYARWLELVPSGVKVSCSEEGYKLQPPLDTRYQAAFDTLKASCGIRTDLLLRIPQTTRNNALYDNEDRVERGARLLKDLLAMQPS